MLHFFQVTESGSLKYQPKRINALGKIEHDRLVRNNLCIIVQVPLGVSNGSVSMPSSHVRVTRFES